MKDIAEAIVSNLERPVRGVYNLAATNIQIKDLAAIVSQMTGCRVLYTEEKFQDQRNYHVTTQKALRDGVFNPNTMRSIQDGVREIIGLVRVGRIKQTENDVYFNVRHVENLATHGQSA